VTYSSDCAIGEVVESAKKAYENLKKYYEADHIRRMVHSIIFSMQPTSLKSSGSVYFIPQKYLGRVEALSSVLKELGAEFYHMSVLDEENATAAVREKLIAQTDRAMQAMTDALADREELTASDVGAMLEDAKRIVEQIKDYEALLKTDLADLQSRVQLVQAQMIALLQADVA